jgi:hypothetical protein
MEDELNLTDYFKVINKRKKLIIAITLIILLIGAFRSIAKPKLYESEATIQLAMLPVFSQGGDITDSRFLISHEEAKNIIESSTILDPVLDKFFKKESRPSAKSFARSSLNVEIVFEEVGNRGLLLPPFLKIKVKALDPIISQKIALAIANEWINYNYDKFNKTKELIFAHYSKSKNKISESLYKTEYSSTISNLEDRISKTEDNIYTYQNELAEIGSKIKATSSLSEGDVDKATLLITSLDTRLSNEQNILLNLEGRLTNTKLNFQDIELREENKREIQERAYAELLLYIKEPKIIDYPNVPKGPINVNFRQDLLMHLGIGLFLSVALAFVLEWHKKNISKIK